MTALALTVVLPIAIMTVILPFQGLGWGYRYAHGSLGSVALLAGQGWHLLGPKRRSYRPLLTWTTIATLTVLLPFQMWSAYRPLRPFAQADQRIENSGTDYFIVADRNGKYTENLVFNLPDLTNRPVRLLASKVSDPTRLAHRLCAKRAVIGFGSKQFYVAGFERQRPVRPVDTLKPMQELFALAGCRLRTVN